MDPFILWFVVPLAIPVAIAAYQSPWSWRRFFKRLLLGSLVVLAVLVLFIVAMFALFPPDTNFLNPI